ncbi:hypothetical protein [Thioclava sp. ES.031]|uniref:hypothetical protein n=1 Tax=Thioclava sp. ES.031 TaxID=1798203 RepID=UPI000BF4AD0E|nr:hypothetical protein [Thioclava sp. ES.031]
MKDFERDLHLPRAPEVGIDPRPISVALGMSNEAVIDLGRSSTVLDDFVAGVVLDLSDPNGFKIVHNRAEAIAVRRNVISNLPPLTIIPRLVFSASLVEEKGAENECHTPLFYEVDPDGVFDGYVFFDMRQFPRVRVFRLSYFTVERFLLEERLNDKPFTEREFDFLIQGKFRP